MKRDTVGAFRLPYATIEKGERVYIDNQLYSIRLFQLSVRIFRCCDEIVRAFRAVMMVSAMRVQQGRCKGLLPFPEVPE